MLTRQKIILGLLLESGGKASKLELVKWAFLFRQENAAVNAVAFYDFVPYKYGPFSFCLYRELSLLEGVGYLEITKDSLAMTIGFVQSARERIASLPSRTRSAITQVNQKYSGLSQNQLLKIVYAQYPWYASKSERKDLARAASHFQHRPAHSINTIGYEGKTADAFFARILKYGIRRVIDIRWNPISRKYGFSKKSLSHIARRLGVEYIHIPAVGVPGELRGDLTDFQSYQRLLAAYETTVLPQRKTEVNRIAALMTEEPSILLCMEKDVNCCHRGRLAQAISRATHLPIRHL